MKHETPIITPTVSASLANNSTINQNNSTSINPPTQARISVPDTASVSSVNSVVGPPQNTTGHKRKRRRKVPTDQIETIKAPSILGQQEASAKEPELELKLN